MTSEQKLQTGTELDEQLAGMLEIERFEPPERFRAHALLGDAAVYEKADATR